MRGSQKEMPPIFDLILFRSQTHENSTEFPYNIAKGTGICHYQLHPCQQLSSTFEEEHVFPPGQSCSPSFAVTGA
jgi:hypothetical protein